MKISSEKIQDLLSYERLIIHLRKAFASANYHIPERSHFQLPNGNLSLVMPAWNEKYYGLKQILVCPGNEAFDLPTIQGKYDLYDIKNGQHLAEIDAPKLTAVRTAATSVMASTFFVTAPKKIVIMGGGVIGTHLKEAYNAFYRLDRTTIWTRSTTDNIDLPKEIQGADIVSCATLATQPILMGKWVKSRTHIDLIGSYKADMREVDDAMISKCDIYVDDWHALKESGDLVIPLSEKVISEKDIKGTLFELCRKEKKPTISKRPTLFKSVGHAVEDLAAAIYFYESYF